VPSGRCYKTLFR